MIHGQARAHSSPLSAPHSCSSVDSSTRTRRDSSARDRWLESVLSAIRSISGTGRCGRSTTSSMEKCRRSSKRWCWSSSRSFSPTRPMPSLSAPRVAVNVAGRKLWFSSGSWWSLDCWDCALGNQRDSRYAQPATQRRRYPCP